MVRGAAQRHQPRCAKARIGRDPRARSAEQLALEGRVSYACPSPCAIADTSLNRLCSAVF